MSDLSNFFVKELSKNFKKIFTASDRGFFDLSYSNRAAEIFEQFNIYYTTANSHKVFRNREILWNKEFHAFGIQLFQDGQYSIQYEENPLTEGVNRYKNRVVLQFMQREFISSGLYFRCRNSLVYTKYEKKNGIVYSTLYKDGDKIDEIDATGHFILKQELVFKDGFYYAKTEDDIVFQYYYYDDTVNERHTSMILRGEKLVGFKDGIAVTSSTSGDMILLDGEKYATGLNPLVVGDAIYYFVEDEVDHHKSDLYKNKEMIAQLCSTLDDRDRAEIYECGFSPCTISAIGMATVMVCGRDYVVFSSNTDADEYYIGKEKLVFPSGFEVKNIRTVCFIFNHDGLSKFFFQSKDMVDELLSNENIYMMDYLGKGEMGEPVLIIKNAELIGVVPSANV